MTPIGTVYLFGRYELLPDGKINDLAWFAHYNDNYDASRCILVWEDAESLGQHLSSLAPFDRYPEVSAKPDPGFARRHPIHVRMVVARIYTAPLEGINTAHLTPDRGDYSFSRYAIQYPTRKAKSHVDICQEGAADFSLPPGKELWLEFVVPPDNLIAKEKESQ